MYRLGCLYYMWGDFCSGIPRYRKEKWDLSEKYWLRAAEYGDVRAMYNLGSLYWKQAVEASTQDFLLKDANATAIYNLGKLYSEKEKSVSAEKYYLRAVEKGNVRAMGALILLYLHQKKHDLAERYLRMVFEYKHKTAQKLPCAIIMSGYLSFGESYQDMGNFTLAEKYYLLALDLDDTQKGGSSYSMAENGLRWLYENQKVCPLNR